MLLQITYFFNAFSQYDIFPFWKWHCLSYKDHFSHETFHWNQIVLFYYFNFFLPCFDLGSYLVVLRAYFRLCTKGSLLVRQRTVCVTENQVQGKFPATVPPLCPQFDFLNECCLQFKTVKNSFRKSKLEC